MVKTIHRRPIVVDTDIDNNAQFFNHLNWKGICTVKNYPNLDPETFEDCKNVYIDEQGLLKSRPMFRAANPLDTDDNIVNIWSFENIQAYLCRNTKNAKTYNARKSNEISQDIGLAFGPAEEYINVDYGVPAGYSHSYTVDVPNAYVTNLDIKKWGKISFKCRALGNDVILSCRSMGNVGSLTTIGTDAWKDYTLINISNDGDFYATWNVYMDGKFISKASTNRINNIFKFERNPKDSTLYFTEVRAVEKGNVEIPEPEITYDYVLKIRETVNDQYLSTELSVDENVKLVKFDDKILIFSNAGLKYYVNGQIFDATNYIYKPVKYVVTNGVVEEYESDNLLTNEYYERYVYTGIDKILNPLFVGKEVVLRYNDIVKNITFSEGTENVIFVPKFTVKSVNYDDDESLLQISELNNIILSTKNNEGEYSIYYSPNGNVWTLLDTVTDVIGEPIISKDGTFVVIFKKDGPWALSLLENSLTGTKIFQNWTNLLTYHNVSTTLPEIGNKGTSNEVYKCVSGCFKDDSHFVYCYGITPNIIDNKLHFEELKVVTYSSDYETALNSYTKSPISDTVYIKNDKCFCDVKDTVNDAAFAVHAYDSYSNSYNAQLFKIMLPAETVSNVYKIQDFRIPPQYYISYKFVYRNINGDLCLYDFTNNIPITLLGSKAVILNNGDVLTDKAYYNFAGDKFSVAKLDTPVDTLIKTYSNNAYYISGKTVYSNYIGDNIVTVDVKNGEGDNLFVYEHYCELNQHYFSKGNALYISSYRTDDDGKLMLYLPKLNEQKFNNHITNIRPVSETQIAIFFKDEIWHTDISDNGEYLYYKTKLQTGCLEGSDVITSVDGKNIIFSSTRGLVYMSYQELVQSTEQTLTYLSDVLFDVYKKFNEKPVKLFLNDFWLYCYHTDEKLFYIFDLRNSSWWKWEYCYPILNIIRIDDKLYFATEQGFRSCTNDIDSEGYLDEEGVIEWYVLSQKLMFETLSYTKNIASITINNVCDEDYKEISFNLQITNYRDSGHSSYVEPKTLVYKVNLLRTYVKRCNVRKVNQFQYLLSSDTGENGNAIQTQFSIHSIIVKYSIAGQVR